MYVLDFSIELKNAEFSLTLLKSDSTTDALPAILKFLRTNKGTLEVEPVFGYRWVDWTAQNLLKGTLLKTFFDNFPKLSQQQFFQRSLKNL